MPTIAGSTPGQEERQATDRRQATTSETIRATTSNLTVLYGAIGIPAVAAALRYTVAAKNPAYAPVVLRVVDPRRFEFAA